ncbi:hypothetical protein BGW38_008338 [Lunasporangiospora selenospora]|uniref:Uncharacterized protein n=1 Tax=Lunasporangiospora selenospora TaxID=979761 RepID=A0A9P6FZ42_9FUNG|nr:hypothetical protein BGW38_008338 [Lunasporangiospora selenospora]
MTDRAKKQIRDAWDWMKQHHPLINSLNIDEPSDLMNATENVVVYDSESSGRRNINVSGLRAYHTGLVGTGGPRTANELSNLDNLPIGGSGGDQQLVKYSNPRLLEYLFPTLYPEGRGFFSKDYDGIQTGHNQRIQYHEYVINQEEGEDEAETFSAGNDDSKYSKHTTKSYAKFRLLGLDRRRGRNVKFILMMFDWIQKAAVFGYQMRLAPATTAGKATRAHMMSWSAQTIV